MWRFENPVLKSGQTLINQKYFNITFFNIKLDQKITSALAACSKPCLRFYDLIIPSPNKFLKKTKQF
jgi:hypothetical protein